MITNNWKEWYRTEYLNSDHWKKFRQKIIRERNCCEECFREDCVLHVHHLHYCTLYREDGYDVAVLCTLCHKKAHSPKRQWERRFETWAFKIYGRYWRKKLSSKSVFKHFRHWLRSKGYRNPPDQLREKESHQLETEVRHFSSQDCQRLLNNLQRSQQ